MENDLRIAICEDSDDDALLLQSYAERCGIPLLCERFESGEALLNSFCVGRYDLIFMDIYMKGMDGIKVAETIRETDRNVMIAFITVSRDHTLEGYRLKAPVYLEKGTMKAEDVKDALELALGKRNARASIILLIGGRQTSVPLDSIHFFEQQDHTVKVHTSFGILQTSQTVRMNDIESRLPSPPFYRCYHSFIVNMEYTRKVDMDFFFFVMHNGDNVLIRQRIAGKMKKAFEAYHAGRTRSGK